MAEPKQYTQTGALWAVGMFKPYDVVVASMFVLSWFIAIMWMIFGTPDLLKLVLVAVGNMTFLLAWLISLVYRAIWFIVKQWADIKLLPAQAAKLAVAFTQGQAPPPANG